MQVRTRRNEDPTGKTRIFFSYHESDRIRCFEKICKDILEIIDAAIYYIDDNIEEDTENLEIDLRQMSLFVIPVSSIMLTSSCFARDFALPFAKTEHIPILPIKLDKGIDRLYSEEVFFGKIQYLDPYSDDETSYNYEKRLSDYLSSVLIGDELAARVRKAFDAYVFLSYRKKDRKYANELIRFIHDDPILRDIAIWYDEYLVPGERFNDAIIRAMEKSEFFTLLVTPNLVNESNYVQEEEYPSAVKSKMSILPVEMLPTDRKALEEQYPGIPPCVSYENDRHLRKMFLENLDRIAKTENDADLEHNFLIGIAYLNGIDVEVNRGKAFDLISKTAKTGFPEAMIKLSSMYWRGEGVGIDPIKSIQWLEKSFDYFFDRNENNADKLKEVLSKINLQCWEIEEYNESVVYNKKYVKYLMTRLGRKDPKVLDAYYDLATAYSMQGINQGSLSKNRKAIRILKKIYNEEKQIYGNDEPESLDLLCEIAHLYSYVNIRRSTKLYEYILRSYIRDYGELDYDSMRILYNLATNYRYKNNKKSLEKLNLLYGLSSSDLDQYSNFFVMATEDMVEIYDSSGKRDKAFELLIHSSNLIIDNKIVEQLSLIDNTASILEKTAIRYSEENDHEKSYELFNILVKNANISESIMDKLIFLKLICNLAYEKKMCDNNEAYVPLEKRVSTEREKIFEGCHFTPEDYEYDAYMSWVNISVKNFIYTFKSFSYIDILRVQSLIEDNIKKQQSS